MSQMCELYCVKYDDEKCGAFTKKNIKTTAVTYTKSASVWLPDQLAGYITKSENRLRDFHENFCYQRI